MKKALLFLIVIASAEASFAGLIVTATSQPLGDGEYGFNIYLTDTSNTEAPWALSNFTITGKILQETANGKAINDNVAAASQNGQHGYDMAMDSFFFQPFTQHSPTKGILSTPNSFSITAGTGTGSAFNKIEIAHIAAASPVLHYSGTITRLGQTCQVSGFVVVPEPAAWHLLASGAFGLLPLFLWRIRR